MAAITSPLLAREVVHQLAKRSWPSENVGVMVVFAIVAVVALALIALYVQKTLAKRRAAKPTF